jgi:hypothetical protein
LDAGIASLTELKLNQIMYCTYCLKRFFFIAIHSFWKEELLPINNTAIDYRFEDDCFPVTASFVTIPNPDSLSSIETGDTWNKKLKYITYLIDLDVRKPLLVYISQRSEELRLYNLV